MLSNLAISVPDVELVTYQNALRDFIDYSKSILERMDSIIKEFVHLKDLIKPIEGMPILHSWSENIIKIYNFSLELKKQVTVNQSFSQGAGSISHFNRIFIIGGWSPALYDTYDIEINNGKVTKKAMMLQAKGHTGLCKRYTEIFGIGGWNGVAMSDCEKYSITNDKWEPIANLQTPIHASAVFLYDLRYIYSICGFSTGCTNIAERLCI